MIIPDDSNKVIDLLLNKMKNFGMNYKISKINNEPKHGQIPPIDIDNVEKVISEYESKSQKTPVEIEYLLELYSKAVEYYSATNNSKYEIYTEKIRNTLQSDETVENINKNKQQDHTDVKEGGDAERSSDIKYEKEPETTNPEDNSSSPKNENLTVADEDIHDQTDNTNNHPNDNNPPLKEESKKDEIPSFQNESIGKKIEIEPSDNENENVKIYDEEDDD